VQNLANTFRNTRVDKVCKSNFQHFVLIIN